MCSPPGGVNRRGDDYTVFPARAGMNRSPNVNTLFPARAGIIVTLMQDDVFPARAGMNRRLAALEGATDDPRAG